MHPIVARLFLVILILMLGVCLAIQYSDKSIMMRGEGGQGVPPPKKNNSK